MKRHGSLSDELEKILASSQLEPALKKALHGTLAAIAERQDMLTAELKNALGMERQAVDNISNRSFPVFTALADNSSLDELAPYGWYAVGNMAAPFSANVEDVFRQIFFLAVPYEKFTPLCEKRFKGKSAAGQFEYEFYPFFGYVEAEKQLDLLWRLYGVKTPAIWSPWSRRAAGLRIYGEPSGKIDLCFAENGLLNIPLADKTVVWNLEWRVGEDASGREKIAPRGENIVWRNYYTTQDDDIQLWPLPHAVINGEVEPEEIDVLATGEQMILSCGKKFASLACDKIAFHAPADPKMRIFANEIGQGAPESPVSRGQFNRLLAAFSKDGYGCRIAQNNHGNVVARYQTAHRTGPVDRLTLLRNQDDVVDIEFYCERTPDIFLGDYANWVLGELERRFPLFSFRGLYP